MLLSAEALTAGGFRLGEPLGYSNATAVLAATGFVLALGFAAHERLDVRAASALALVVLLPTLYLTLSRGGMLAAAAGAVLLALLHPRRARVIASALLLGAPAVLAVVLVSQGASGGRELRLVVLATGVLAVGAAAAAAVVESRVRFPAAAARALVAAAATATLAAVVLAGLVVGEHTASGASDPGDDGPDRLLSADSSYRSDYWRVAWEMVRDEPLTGTGAGSWEAHWLRERPMAFDTRDAHNLYLELLAELGPAGLALLLGTFALPFLAIGRARHTAWGPAAGAALGTVLLHAGLDWDWEIPAVILPALGCAAVLLAAAPRASSARLTGARRLVALGFALPVVAVALVAHVGNVAARASADAAARGDAEAALEHARRAIAWAPWSEHAWELRGEAELLLRDEESARTSLRRALELNDRSWSAWLDLAVATEGSERRRALERVETLNPLSAEADDVRAALRTNP